MKSWIATMLGAALGASVGLATFDAVIVAARGRPGAASLAGVWLASLGTAAVLSILPAIALGALVAARVAGEAPGDWARRARASGARQIVGATVGLATWTALVGGAAYAFALNMRTDSLRLTAVSLVAVAAAPVGWLCGAAAGAVASGRLSGRPALVIPGLVIVGAGAIVAAMGEALAGAGATSALALGAAGLFVAARGSRRARIAIVLAMVLACGSVAVPRRAEVGAALASEATSVSLVVRVLLRGSD